jgi:hypothetical protein
MNVGSSMQFATAVVSEEVTSSDCGVIILRLLPGWEQPMRCHAAAPDLARTRF